VSSELLVQQVEPRLKVAQRDAKMRKKDVSFFFGEFEGGRLPLADALIAAGVPKEIAFTGDGSLSFFQRGKHLCKMRSVIGEGTWAVWRQINKSFEK